jgi:hypothetical protein
VTKGFIAHPLHAQSYKYEGPPHPSHELLAISRMCTKLLTKLSSHLCYDDYHDGVIKQIISTRTNTYHYQHGM